MPNTKQAKKRLRQSAEKKVRNSAMKTQVRSTLRKFREAMDANNLEEAQKFAQVAGQQLDKFAARGVFHKNKAARTKSRMSKQLVASKSS